MTARACNARSAITGIPSGRRRPFFFGTYTRLTGFGDHGRARWCTQSTKSALSRALTATLPSTPAVMRPALISATRRTLISALAREQHQLLKIADLLQTPCLRGHEDPLPQPPYVLLNRPPPHSIPVNKVVLGSVHHDRGVQLAPSVPASSLIGLRKLTRPASAPFQVKAPTSIRPVMREPLTKEPASGSRFPAAFRLPAFASRVILPPLGNSAFLTVGLPSNDSLGPQRDCHVPHETDTTGMGVLCTPGTVVRSRLASLPQPAPAALQRPAPGLPLQHSISESLDHEAFIEDSRSSPVRPSPTCNPRMERGSLGLSLGLHTPQLPATHAKAGTVPAHWTEHYTSDM